MKSLKSICLSIADLEGDLMYGQISFHYDTMLTVMGAGHPAEMLDHILAPVFWPTMSGQEVEPEKVIKLYKDLMSFKNALKIKELNPHIKALKEYMQENGMLEEKPKLKISDLNKKYVGKKIDVEKFIHAGDVWNTGVSNGEMSGHFYWDDERHRYYDEFSILVTEDLIITKIQPLETNYADDNGIDSCRYTMVHNSEFDRLLNAATAEE